MNTRKQSLFETMRAAMMLAVMMMAMFTSATQAQAQEIVTINVTISPAEGGTVTGAGTYEKNANVTLTATPKEGYEFLFWSDTESSVFVSRNNPYTFLASTHNSLTASFKKTNGGGSNEGGTGDGTNPSQSEGGTGEGTGTGTAPVSGEGTGTGTSPVNPGTGTDTPVNPGTGTDTPAETGEKRTIRVSTYNHGSVTTDKTSAAEGETVTLTVTPDDGYHLASLYLEDGQSIVYPYSHIVPVQSTTDPSKYTFLAPATQKYSAELNVHATFEKDNDNPSQGSGTGEGSGDANTFSITVAADPAEGGTVTGGSSGSYAKDTRLEFKETPNEGYRFKNWTIDGINGGPEDTYLFDVDGNFSTVVAHFERVYKLKNSPNKPTVYFYPEGSYDPITEAAEGETVVVCADPEQTPNGKYLSGYSATAGVKLTPQPESIDATFIMPAMDVTVDAVYTDQKEYTIDLTTSSTAALPQMIYVMLQRIATDVNSQYLDLNGDGTNDLELTVNQDFTTFYVTKLVGGYSKDTHVALPVETNENSQYNSVFFKLGNEVGGEAKDIKTLTITLSGTEFTYTGQPIKPTVTVKDGNTSVAVTLEYSKNRDAGEATVTVTANAAGYTGSVTKTFTIAPKEVKVSGLSAEEKNYDPNNSVATINCRGAVFNGLIEGDELTISDVTGTYIIGENVDAMLDVTLDYTNATLGGKSAANYKLATEDNQATTTITIHKVLQTVTITFDPNGGTGELDLQSAQKGETVSLKDNIFYRQGYSFKNWNTKADGSGDKYEDRQSIKIDEDLTLYAQWEKEENIIETNIETKKNLDGSTTTIVTSKETDSSGKLVKESNTSTTQYPDGSKKILESKTPETDGNRLYVSEDGTLTGIDLGNSILFGGVSRDNIVGIIQNSTQGSGGSDAQPDILIAQPDILIAQGNESHVLVYKETEIDPQGEVTATSASLTVKQTGDSDPTQIAINAGGGVNPGAPTSGKFGNFTWEVSKSDASSSVYDVLTISDSGQMDDMIEVSPWDAYHNQIKTVIIGEGVTSIGHDAFASVPENTTVGISITAAAGSQLRAIDKYAFSYANASIDLSNCTLLEAIGSDMVFCQVTGDVTLPSSVTSICQYAFENENSQPYPGNHVYITVPDGNVLKVTIAGVTDPVEITPTNGKADIINCLFDDPSKRIASRALTLKIVDASTGGEGGGDNGGGSENPDAPTSGKCGKNVTWTLTKSDANSTVYDVLTISGEGYMEGSPWETYKEQIKTVKISGNVMNISGSAFNGCPNLTSVDIPRFLKTIGEEAFWNCSSLTSVTIPDGATSIGYGAFYGCSSLTSVNIPEHLTSIGVMTFYYCSSLTSVNIPASVTSIRTDAFSDSGVNHVYITVPQDKALKVMIAGVTDPVEITPTNGKADIIGCLFDDPSIRGASRALTLEIVDPSTVNEVPSTQDSKGQAATTMIVNFETKKVNEHASPTVPSQITVNGVTYWVTSINHLFGRSRAATAEEEEDDEIEIVSGQEYELLHDGYIVLNFYTPDAPITVKSIVFRRPGDANNDGYVDAADLVEMINAKADKASERFNLTNADIDRDGEITQDDIDAVVKLIMEPKDKGDE